MPNPTRCRRAVTRTVAPHRNARRIEGSTVASVIGPFERQEDQVKSDWTPEHDEFLKLFLFRGYGTKVIAWALTRKFGAPRTQSSVRGRIFRLGLSFQKWPLVPFTERELGIAPPGPDPDLVRGARPNPSHRAVHADGV